ncbi:MAG: 4Fe-4S binding protein, partial [Phycisphaerae bacterium]
GRFFCGWVCPIGTALDYFHRLFQPLTRRTNIWGQKYVSRWRPLRYIVLLVVLLTALFAWPVVGFLDPFSLWMRLWTIVLDPAWYSGTTAVVAQAYQYPHWLAKPVTSTYGFMANHNIIPFGSSVFHLVGVTLGIALVVVLLEFVARRFWCRYVCPLGGMLGLVGRWSLVRRLPSRSCTNCRARENCGVLCRMGAFDEQGKLIPESCNLCMDCVAKCPDDVARFKVKVPPTIPATPVGLSRRGVLTAVVAGTAIPLVAKMADGIVNQDPPPHLLRPPGVHGEADFLNLCIRCGECMKVCVNNALQPAGLETGVKGLFSPVLIPRQNYCEYGCTLCGQVCPTGAIPNLAVAVKNKTVIGKAAFDRKRCLPWAKDETCLVCQEQCPLPQKAITTTTCLITQADGKTKLLKRPHVDRDLCIGCGICENKCPLDGPAAIRVYRTEAVPPASGEHMRRRMRLGRPGSHPQRGKQ